MIWHLWIRRAKHPGPTSLSSDVGGIEFLNVGGRLTQGDFALEVGVDFLAVAEHRLIPARVRSEWSRLRKKGLASIWAPVSQDSSHVGNAGVGVVSLRGAPVSLPTFATAQFKRFSTVVVLFVASFLLVLGCTWLFCMVIRVLMLMLSSLL